MGSAASLWLWGRTTPGECWGWSSGEGNELGAAPLSRTCCLCRSCPAPVMCQGRGAVLTAVVPPPLCSLFLRALLDQVEHWQSFLALVNMIMFCTGIPGHYPVNETTSSLTLTFWYTLQVSGHHGSVLLSRQDSRHQCTGLGSGLVVFDSQGLPMLLLHTLHSQSPQGTYLRNAGPVACIFPPPVFLGSVSQALRASLT